MNTSTDSGLMETGSQVMDYAQIIAKSNPQPTRASRVAGWIFEKLVHLRVDNFFMIGLLLLGALIPQSADTPVVIWIHAQSHMSAYTWAAFMQGSAALAYALKRWYGISAFISFLPFLAIVVFHIQYILVTDAPDYIVVLYAAMLFAFMTIAICGPQVFHLINLLSASEYERTRLENENRMLKARENATDTTAQS